MKTIMRIMAKILYIIFLLICFCLMVIGYRAEETPSINNILAMLLPKMLPKMMSDFPFRLAILLTTSSGAEVPKATMVRPTINSGI